MENKLTLSYAPHVKQHITTSRIMLDVIVALIPAFIASVLLFGPRAALITVICITACVLFELFFQLYTKRDITIQDLSAVITGILLGFNLPVTIPIWQAVIGSFIAIILIKQLFGGIGKNFANPAITARIILFLAFTGTMTTWYMPLPIPDWVRLTDVVASPTPLAYINQHNLIGAPSLLSMFLGIHGGTIGETSALALLIGGIYLMARRIITWHIPCTFIATVFILSFIFSGFDIIHGSYHVLAGGVMLGAFFMATDYVTSPQTKMGRIIFGIGCGFFTVIIRFFGSYPEGVSFAILLMNVITPFIIKYTKTKPLGKLKTKKTEGASA